MILLNLKWYIYIYIIFICECNSISASAAWLYFVLCQRGYRRIRKVFRYWYRIIIVLILFRFYLILLFIFYHKLMCVCAKQFDYFIFIIAFSLLLHLCVSTNNIGMASLTVAQLEICILTEQQHRWCHTACFKRSVRHHFIIRHQPSIMISWSVTRSRHCISQSPVGVVL